MLFLITSCSLSDRHGLAIVQVIFLDLSFVAFFFLCQTRDKDTLEHRLRTEAELKERERDTGRSIEYAKDTEETG